MRLELGCEVRCADGVFGELADVVIDPVSRCLTHLVVQRQDRSDAARLVPIDLLRTEISADAVTLGETVGELMAREDLRESAYLRLDELPRSDPGWSVGIEDTYALPTSAVADGLAVGPVDIDPHVMVTFDRIPEGHVELRRSSHVWSADEHRLGHVDALVVDDGLRITHLVLLHGHLWGRRDVAIPIASVQTVDNDEVRLTLSKDGVGALPHTRVHRHEA